MIVVPAAVTPDDKSSKLPPDVMVKVDDVNPKIDVVAVIGPDVEKVELSIITLSTPEPVRVHSP